jgi:hypothetical protein
MFCLLCSPKQKIVKFHVQKQIGERHVIDIFTMENISLCIFQYLTLYYIINFDNILFNSIATCNRIRSIGNGRVYGRSNLEGDKLSFRCRTDYILDGEQFIKCTGNRRWNATKPTCRGWQNNCI